MARVHWLFLGLALAGLAACGKVGSLDQPAPLYGEKAKAEYQARRAAEAEAAKAAKEDGQPEALAPDTPPVPGAASAGPDPIREDPVQGMPVGANPPGPGSPPH